MPITATFPIMDFPHRGILSRDNFVLAQETSQDILAGTYTTNLNLLASQANALAITVNASEIAAVSAANFKGVWTNQMTAIGESWLYDSFVYIVVVAGNTSPITSPANWYADSLFNVRKDSATGAAYLPAGTTAQRPVSPINGYMRYNSDLLAMEAYVN